MATASYSASGVKATTAAKLPKEIFAVEVTNHELLKDAYVTYMANGRINLAKTLKRGQVSGGGKKPWAQKGTGNARVGSSRNPIWRGGGITLGQSCNENYSRKLSTKAKQTALRQALSLAVANKNLLVIDEFAVKDGKTQTAQKLLAKLGTPSRVLIVVDAKSPTVTRATNNLQEVIICTASGLNVFDVLNAAHIVITKDALAAIETRLNGGTK